MGDAAAPDSRVAGADDALKIYSRSGIGARVGFGRRPAEPVWTKRASSAFFGTPLQTFLIAAGVDTLVVTGCVTSGCVRATVVDAVSWGYRVIVPEECVGDRAEGPHAWNLFDIDAKYADVEP